jgi:hypothetical protein
MKRSDEEEQQRFLGFPVSAWSQGTRPDVHSLRHPVAWIRWRLAVRRRGPYAPELKEFLRDPPDNPGGAP